MNDIQPSSQGIRARLIWLAPFVVTALYACIHVWWLAHDTTGLYWDQGRHGENALATFDLLRNGSFPLGRRLMELSEGPDPYYPPFFYWLSVIPLAVLPRSADSITMTCVIFAAVMNLSAFAIARRLAGDVAGVLASIVASAFPILFDFTNEPFLDFPLTAMVALTLWLAMERPFDTCRRAALLGAVLGFGFLTKWTYPAFVLLPCGFALAESLWPAREAPSRRRVLASALVSVAVGAVIALPWFLNHRKHLLGTREASSHVPGLGGETFSNLGARLADYFHTLFHWQADLLSVAMLAAALVFLATSREKLRRSAPLLLCLLSSIVAWGVLGKHVDPRYSMPQLAAAVPLIACWPSFAERFVGRRLRMAGQGLVVLWAVSATVNLAVAPEIFRGELLQRSRLFAQFAFHSGAPKDNPGEEPFNTIFREIAQSKRIPTATLAESPIEMRGVDGWSSRFYAALHGVFMTRGFSSFTIRPVKDRSAAGSSSPNSRWYPIPGEPLGGVEVFETFRSWERPSRESRGERLQRAVVLAGSGWFVVEAAGPRGTLVVVEGGREVGGAALSPAAPERRLVRAGPGTRVEAWGIEPVSLSAGAADRTSLAKAEIGVELGLYFPVSGLARGEEIVDGGGKDPRSLLAGPYLKLPPADYRADFGYRLASRLTGAQRILLSAVPSRHIKLRTAPLDAGNGPEPGVGAELEGSFALRGIARRAEVKVGLEKLEPGQLEGRSMTLWVGGIEPLETMLAWNPTALVHRCFFRLRER